MTDNTQLKADAAELLIKIKNFNRNYNLLETKSGPSVDFSKELKMILKVARTDEENKEQAKIDTYC